MTMADPLPHMDRDDLVAMIRRMQVEVEAWRKWKNDKKVDSLLDWLLFYCTKGWEIEATNRRHMLNADVKPQLLRLCRAWKEMRREAGDVD